MSRRIAFVLLVAGALSACADGRNSSRGSSKSGDVAAAPQSAAAQVAATDARARVPSFMWANRASASTSTRTPGGIGPGGAVAAARQHVASFASHYRITPAQVSELELRDLHDTGRGAIIARFARRIDGVEVFGERLSVAMDRQLDVVALSGYVTGDVPLMLKKLGTRARDTFVIDTLAAMRVAASDLSGVTLALADFEPLQAAPGSYETARFTAAAAARATGGASVEPVRARRVFHRTKPDTLLPAYYVEVDLGDDASRRPRHFAYLINATDGTVLTRNDLTAYENPVTYRVYADASGLYVPWDGPEGTAVTPHPTGEADGFQPPFVSAQLATLSSLTSVGVGDPWLPPGARETLGNNVDAYLDLAAPDGFTPGSADFRGTASAPGVFDYVFDHSLGANSNVTQRQAAVTQLFFNTNWMHDWYYAAGFTETAGNAQFSNFGRGGVEGDGLRAEAQDFTSFNNANMSTPADGGRPRMQMYLWTKPTDLRLVVDTPDTLAGTFTNLNTASFGPLNFNLSGNIVRANPPDACAPLVGDFAGKIVFADRGGPATCGGFAAKTERVQAAGGIAIIIANVATSANPTLAPAMGGTPVGRVTIGAVSMNQPDGDRFRAAFAGGAVASGSVVRAVRLLDGDIDNQIVAHEWGHYISNRLIFDGSGLQDNMARGLGEGWADFHAMLMTVREEDAQSPSNANWAGTYGLAGYATSTDPNSYYFGIRRYPYSTDMAKNPLTFRHISDVNPLPTNPPPHVGGATNSEVHNSGEVWTTMLWECYASLLRDTLGESPRLTFAQARDRMRDYLVAAYKLTPANPTLLEARDALLAAALVADPADYQLFGAAFAKRGAGSNAVAPPRGENTNTPVVESFAFGPDVQQVGATLGDDVSATCGPDNILDDGETGTLRVTFRNAGSADTPALAATVSSSTAGITFPDGDAVLVPAMPRAGTADATIRVAANGLAPHTSIVLTVTTPDAGAGETAPVSYAFPGNADEIAGGSSTDTAEGSTDVWLRTSSLGTPPPEALFTKVLTSSSNHAYRCRSASVIATSELTSPPIPVGAGQTLRLAFNHRFSFERDAINNLNFDGGVIEVSNDEGVTWTDVFALPGSGVAYNGLLDAGSALGGQPAFTGTSPGYPAFNAAAVNLGTGFGGQVVRLRFRVSSDEAVSTPGWEIDDIQITGSLALPFATLVPQSATCNTQPIANVGLSQAVPETGPAPTFAPTSVFLDGSASIDPNGNPLTYEWIQVGGPPVALDDPTARIARFTAPQIPRTASPASLFFLLVVSDGLVSSAPRFTAVRVVNVNRPPVANAGPAQSVVAGATVTLDGSGSLDPDPGDPALTFNWTAPAGITLSSATVAQPTFVAPAVTATTTFTFNLVVSDGLASSAPSSVSITVAPANRAPVASAGADQTVFERATVTLDGSGSVDPDGDALTYAWTAPRGIRLSGATTVGPSFVAPSVRNATTFALSLVVTDARGLQSAADTVLVRVRPSRR